MEDHSRMEEAVRTLLEHIDPDPNRPGLKATPGRVVQTLLDFTHGYREDIEEEIKKGMFEGTGHDPVILQDLEFESLCEHHLLPFFGKATVVFIPDRYIVGISKVGRVVDHFAARLQVQERMTAQIAQLLFDLLKPLAVGVTITAFHTCMNLRGPKRRSTLFSTTAIRYKEKESEGWVKELLETFRPRQVL